MSTPGAEMSGFRRPSVVGPRLLNEATASFDELVVSKSSYAPTEKPLKRPLAEESVPDEGPSLDAETAVGIRTANATASK
jgi:hypothetical protein